ncbi:MAG: lytic murein transglycosylase [Hyphomicrobiaceae bacterium]
MTPSECFQIRTRPRPFVGRWYGSAFAMVLIMVNALVLFAPRVQAREAFSVFVDGLWPQAQQMGVSRATFDTAFRGLKPDYSLPDLVLGNRKKPAKVRQAEFVRPPSGYLNAKTLGRLAATGQKLARKHAGVLKRIEDEIGVGRYAVLAIWGRETSYGRYKLPHDAITVLATQAYVGRRKKLFRNELLHALKMLQEGVPRKKMRASWAGAVGMTQFMPTEYFKHAQGLDGGRADLFDSVADALASAARQLKNKGWVSGKTWGYEIVIPKSSSCALEGPPGMRPISEWMALGYRRVAGRKFANHTLQDNAYLMSPAGAYGPSFLVLENFKVLRRYNTSDLYATFVGNLADRISGGGDFVTKWGGQGKQRTEIIRGVQQSLKDKGYPIGKVDGFIGSGTRRQVGQYQEKNKIKVDCWPTPGVLAHMRRN